MKIPMSRLALRLTPMPAVETADSRSVLGNGIYSLACDSLGQKDRLRLQGWLRLDGGRNLDSLLDQTTATEASGKFRIEVRDGEGAPYAATHTNLEGWYLAGRGRQELRLENDEVKLVLDLNGARELELFWKKRTVASA